MKVSEISVSYSNKNPVKVKVTSSQLMYNLILKHWNLELIEYQEEVKIILLNRSNIVLGIHELSKGGMTGSVVDIRIILGVTLKCGASSIIIVHNHPSGKLIASDADKTITSKLKQACELMDISLLDHLIISREGYHSFADEGIL
jgi:DNA repair protein RadC